MLEKRLKSAKQEIPGEDKGNVGGEIVGELKSKIREVGENLRSGNVTELKEQGKRIISDVRQRTEDTREWIDENSTLLIGLGIGALSLGVAGGLAVYFMRKERQSSQMKSGSFSEVAAKNEAMGYGDDME